MTPHTAQESRTTLGELTIAPARPGALADEASGILITGCDPGERVVLSATVEAVGGTFQSEAAFDADGTGTVDTSVSPSLAGTYTGVDPFGLAWSGRPMGPSSRPPSAPVAYRVRAETSSRAVERTIERPWLPSGATLMPVEADGVSGLFARPAGDGPFPAVVALGGSSGGLFPSATWAPALAARGFAALAVAYFGSPGLPDALDRIGVEVVERAITWLTARADIDSHGVAVMGVSRGSELALLAGALLDGVSAVVAVAPSGVSWCAIQPSGIVDAPAWTFRGEDIPYAPRFGAFAAGAASAPPPPAGALGAPVVLRPVFEAALRDEEAVAAAEIPVERIDGPILLVSGGSDAMWPSTDMADIAVRRAERHDFAHRIVHLRYPDAGHSCFGVPGTPVFTETGPHPLTGVSYALGGTRAANAAARADSWPRCLAFLADALR